MAGESFRLKLGSVGPGHSKNRNVQVEAGRLTWHGVCQVHKLNTESDFRMSDQGNAMTSVQEFKSGWRVLLVAAMGVTCGITAVPIYTIGAFVGPLEDAYGWSRGAIQSATVFAYLTLVFAGPAAGYLYGPLWAEASGLMVGVWYFDSGWQCVGIGKHSLGFISGLCVDRHSWCGYIACCLDPRCEQLVCQKTRIGVWNNPHGHRSVRDGRSRLCHLHDR